LADELFGQIAAEERCVALDLAHLEDFFSAGLRLDPRVALLLDLRLVPAPLDVLPYLHAEMIRVDRAARGAQHLIVAYDELELHALRQLERVEDALMPEARPAFVHDLGFDLWDEVLCLFVDDREDISLPVAEDRVVIADEEQQILFGVQRH